MTPGDSSPTLRAPAELPPSGLEGLEPSWSRLVKTPSLDDSGRTWHILDNAVAEPAVTLLCVHGNPSWSYLWRHVIAAAPEDTRVIAVDQLDMGFSERTGTVRRLAQRVDDLLALTDQLDIVGPVVPVAHDWGGPVALGWSMHNRHRLAGVVLTNTAVHQPAGSPAPSIIRLARQPIVRQQVCVRTPAFIKGALRMSRPRPSQAVRDGFMAPYLTPERRAAISTFVEDIPLEPDHPSAEILDQIAASLDHLQHTPALLAWGAADPVFSDLYLRDFQQRLPHAQTHRYPSASHFVHEELDVAGPIHAWVHQVMVPPPDREEGIERVPRPPLWAGIEDRAGDATTASLPAVVQLGDPADRMTFDELREDVEMVAAGLADHGVSPGDRVALLIRPGRDLSVTLYACWRLGAVAVLADAALGATRLGAAIKAAAPDYVIGIDQALAAARTLGWPGERISLTPRTNAPGLVIGASTSLEEIRLAGALAPAPPVPDDDCDAVVVFTSGSTGPSKGVVYKHHQLQAQREAIRTMATLRPQDRLVAAFAPFALFGPALGLPTAVPDMDVTAPGTLTATALAEAARAIEGTVVFASPAALRNVIATAADLTAEDHRAFAQVRLLLSAGAPVSATLLRDAVALFPNATAATPYGMTELLPATVITLDEIEAAGAGRGVCVGPSSEGVLARIAPFDDPEILSREPGVSGEVILRAPHAKDRYDQLWATQQATERPAGWHRTGDVGHLDAQGRLWIEGRTGHVIDTVDGPVTPVGVELAVEALPQVTQAAAVGVGPEGAELVVVVVVPTAARRRPGHAETELIDAVRGAADHPVAAVLVSPHLPTDKRHNSKIDRSTIRDWASAILAGGRFTRLPRTK